MTKHEEETGKLKAELLQVQDYKGKYIVICIGNHMDSSAIWE